MGFALSVLAACELPHIQTSLFPMVVLMIDVDFCAALGVAQFLTHAIAFQWIFAFIIMALLFVFSIIIGIPGLVGEDVFKRGQIVSEDREREPLLQDD